VTVLGVIPMLDFPLQLLIGPVATILFWRGGNQVWVAVGKGVLVSLVATIILSVILWIST
jgi:hypothetical protein